jgi:hypothetical protein
MWSIFLQNLCCNEHDQYMICITIIRKNQKIYLRKTVSHSHEKDVTFQNCKTKNGIFEYVAAPPVY